VSSCRRKRWRRCRPGTRRRIFARRGGLGPVLGSRRPGEADPLLRPAAVCRRAAGLGRAQRAPGLPPAQALTGRANGALPDAPGVPRSLGGPGPATPEAPTLLPRRPGPNFPLRPAVTAYADSLVEPGRDPLAPTPRRTAPKAHMTSPWGDSLSPSGPGDGRSESLPDRSVSLTNPHHRRILSPQWAAAPIEFPILFSPPDRFAVHSHRYVHR